MWCFCVVRCRIFFFVKIYLIQGRGWILWWIFWYIFRVRASCLLFLRLAENRPTINNKVLWASFLFPPICHVLPLSSPRKGETTDAEIKGDPSKRHSLACKRRKRVNIPSYRFRVNIPSYRESAREIDRDMNGCVCVCGIPFIAILLQIYKLFFHLPFQFLIKPAMRANGWTLPLPGCSSPWASAVHN